VFIRGLQHLPQDQEVINGFKTSQNSINTPLKRELKKRGGEKTKETIHKKPKCKGPKA
jgi:hypothetical protein